MKIKKPFVYCFQYEEVAVELCSMNMIPTAAICFQHPGFPSIMLSCSKMVSGFNVVADRRGRVPLGHRKFGISGSLI